MSMKGVDAQRTQKIHASKRFFQRYGVVLSDDKYYKIVSLIRRGKSQVVERRSNSRSVHRLGFDGIKIAAVYDRQTGRVVTFLPDKWEKTTPYDKYEVGKKRHLN